MCSDVTGFKLTPNKWKAKKKNRVYRIMMDTAERYAVGARRYHEL